MNSQEKKATDYTINTTTVPSSEVTRDERHGAGCANLLFGFLILGFSIFTLVNDASDIKEILSRNDSPVLGTVVDSSATEWDKNRTFLVRLKIEYEVNGTLYNCNAEFISDDSFPVDSKIDLVLFDSDPSKAITLNELSVLRKSGSEILTSLLSHLFWFILSIFLVVSGARALRKSRT